jgi:hypothetical protein
VFYNLAAPLGRQIVVGWHDRCAEVEPLRDELVWSARQDAPRWAKLLEAIRARSPSRIGPGDRYARPRLSDDVT